MELHFPPLFLVLIAAACTPIVAEGTRRIGLSIVVIELLLGVAIGPQGMGWVDPRAGSLHAFATLGMAFLFFIAGVEIDPPSIKGGATPVVRAWMLAVSQAAVGRIGTAGVPDRPDPVVPNTYSAAVICHGASQFLPVPLMVA